MHIIYTPRICFQNTQQNFYDEKARNLPLLFIRARMQFDEVAFPASYPLGKQLFHALRTLPALPGSTWIT